MMKDRINERTRDKDKFDRKEHAQRKLLKQRRQEEDVDREWDEDMRNLQMSGLYR
jgi:hypothetical protein